MKKLKRFFTAGAIVAFIPALITNNFWVFGVSMYLFGGFAGVAVFLSLCKEVNE